MCDLPPTQNVSITHDLLPTGEAENLARLCGRLVWLWMSLFLLLVIFMVAQYCGFSSTLEERIGLLIKLTGALVLAFVYRSTWQIVRAAWQSSILALSDRAKMLIRIFLIAVLVRMGITLVYLLQFLVALFGGSLSSYTPWVVVTLIEAVTLLCLTLGLPAVAGVWRSVLERSRPGTSGPSAWWRWHFRVWIFVLAILFVRVVAVLTLYHAAQWKFITPETWRAASGVCGSVQPLITIPVIWSFILLIPLRLRLRRLAVSKLCPSCKYDLHGDLKGGCPECGWGRKADSDAAPTD